MYNYVQQTARNAVYKVAREYEALDMNDSRQDMEQKVREIVISSLKEEQLEGAITISQVQIRKILPAKSVIDSANALVRAKNEFKQKEVEVKTAEAEARKQKMLSDTGPQTIEYMRAQAQLLVAEAVKEGKVQTILIPHGMNILDLPKK